MSARTIQGTSVFTSFCASLSFRRDELLRLAEGGLLTSTAGRRGATAASEAAAEVDGVHVPVAPKPLSADQASKSVWSFLTGTKSFALPCRLQVWLPLRLPQAPAGAPRPRAFTCECLVSPLGIAVKLRFAFDEAPREALVSWPAASSPVALYGSGGRERWNGTVGDAAWLAIRASLASLGKPWSRLAASEAKAAEWKTALGRGVRRVYAEIADCTADVPVPPGRTLLFGLATQAAGYAKVPEDRRKQVILLDLAGGGVLNAGEEQLFAPSGAALYLRYAPGENNLEWRGANCHRRDVVYGLAQHNLLIDQIRTLIHENQDGRDVETVGLTADSRLGDVARVRLATLHDLHSRYPWLLRYSRRQLTADQLDALPAPVKKALGADLLGKVADQLETGTGRSQNGRVVRQP